MFGNTLEGVMLLQADRFPDRRLPWLQTTLTEALLQRNGASTEGIFRIPGDISKVNHIKAMSECFEPPPLEADAHVVATLLKLWYRELAEPLVPPRSYSQSIKAAEDPEAAVQVIKELPPLNKLVLSYLIRFLQVLAAPENVIKTTMDVDNISMVMAPNILKSDSEDPKTIFQNARREMLFVRTLILHMDTTFMEKIL